MGNKRIVQLLLDKGASHGDTLTHDGTVFIQYTIYQRTGEFLEWGTGFYRRLRCGGFQGGRRRGDT